jgi:hypothetical protein
MGNLDFLLICILSLLIVFILLAMLSLSIHLLTKNFPEKSQDDDSVVVAAITTHLSRIYSHQQITKVEEQK